jgi:NAD(P)H-nitrite reductase large subunit
MSSEVIRNPVDKLPPELQIDLEKNLCTCMDVPRIDIINAIANGAHTVEAVRRQTSATLGSKCCVQQIKRLIDCICKEEDAYPY